MADYIVREAINGAWFGFGSFMTASVIAVVVLLDGPALGASLVMVCLGLASCARGVFDAYREMTTGGPNDG